MSIPFRELHLFNILNAYDKQTLPLDVFLSYYFRAHKAVGAKDRRFISETVYGMVRWRGLLDYLIEKPISWESRYRCYQGLDPLSFLENASIPMHIRLSFPKAFFQALSSSLGEEKAKEVCLASNAAAPTTVRVNTLKTTREALLERWKDLYPVTPCLHSPWGILFHQKTNFFAMAEFKEGLFEIQDEGSQLIGIQTDARPNQWVLDFCAGAGGKTLAFAPSMAGSGQIYLHDIRPRALEEAKKRLRRAGIQNAQILLPDDPKKKNLQKKMHTVLVDAPCSGSGTLRRNPDMKWKFDPSLVDRLVQEQRAIVGEALQFLHPKGKLIYATCSIFPQENAEQLLYFKEQYGLEVTQESFQSFPTPAGMDGFFCATLRRVDGKECGVL